MPGDWLLAVNRDVKKYSNKKVRKVNQIEILEPSSTHQSANDAPHRRSSSERRSRNKAENGIRIIYTRALMRRRKATEGTSWGAHKYLLGIPAVRVSSCKTQWLCFTLHGEVFSEWPWIDTPACVNRAKKWGKNKEFEVSSQVNSPEYQRRSTLTKVVLLSIEKHNSCLRQIQYIRNYTLIIT